MNTLSKSFLYFSLILFSFVLSCTKEVGPLTDNRPVTPVTVANAIAYRPEPTVGVSRAGAGTILITLSIPASSPRSINSITKVSASTSFTQIQSAGPTFYNSAPIPGNGKSVNFTTTLSEYTSKTGQGVSAINIELTRRFYFEILLDDNTTIITEPVRVLMLD